MKIIRKILLVLLFMFVVVQFFGPERNEGTLASLDPFFTETHPTDQVKFILKESCLDCHSNKTRYPWYFNVTPINYWMADHIEHGKEELNFSNWSDYSVRRKEHKMEEIWEEVKKKEMPLETYTWTHAGARLTNEQIEALVDWAKEAQANYQKQLNNQK